MYWLPGRRGNLSISMLCRLLNSSLFVFTACPCIEDLESFAHDRIPLWQVKSRMMGDSTYKNTLDCFIKTLRNDVCFHTLPLFPLT